jgi:hypothetical protein
MEIGTWARVGDLVGLVVHVGDDGTTTVFNPGDRRATTVPAGGAQGLPSGRVEVTATVQLDVPHGLGEAALHRWVAALLDPVLRERATTSLSDAGYDLGPLRHEVAVEVREVPRA